MNNINRHLSLALFLLLLLPALAMAAECRVDRSEDFIGVLKEAKGGKCKTNLIKYSDRYDRFFPGKSTFNVIRISDNLKITLGDGFAFGSDEENPLVIISSPTARARFSGNIVLEGKSMILDGIQIVAGERDALTIRSEKALVIESEIKGANGWGVHIESRDVRLVGSHIYDNQSGGILVEGESAALIGNIIHDNGNGRKGATCADSKYSEMLSCSSLITEKKLCQSLAEKTPSCEEPKDILASSESCLREWKSRWRCIDFLSNEAVNSGVNGAAGGVGVLIDAAGARFLKWDDKEGQIYNNAVAGIYVNSFSVALIKPDLDFSIYDLQRAMISGQLLWNNGVGGIVLSRYPLPAPSKIAVSKDKDGFLLRGEINLTVPLWYPWQPSMLDFGSMRVEIYVIDGDFKKLVASVKPDKDGLFEASLGYSLNKPSFTAILVDEEHNSSSPLSAVSVGGAGAGSITEGDADGDGLSDELEIFHKTDPANPDTDGDGLTDGEEVLGIGWLEKGKVRALDKLSPIDADSDDDCIPDGVELGLSLNESLARISKLPRRSHYIMSPYCSSEILKLKLTKYDNIIPYDQTKPSSLDNIAMLYDLAPDAITDPSMPDTDRDGLLDGEEDRDYNGMRNKKKEDFVETDPSVSDSDGDGLLDGEDGRYQADPLARDTDGDGVPDGFEVRRGTDPAKCDSDGDGLSDGVEMGYHTVSADEKSKCHGLGAGGSNYQRKEAMNPLNPDSDGDGLKDGEEDKNGNGWVEVDESDPSLQDSDGDGIVDYIEYRADFNGDGKPDFDVQLLRNGKGCTPPASITDVDCDGTPNSSDLDSDGDGCADEEEGRKDSDLDGIPDFMDAQMKNCPVIDTGTTPSVSPGSPKKEGEKKVDSDSRGGALNVVGSGGDPNDNAACAISSTNSTGIYSVFVLFFCLFPIWLRKLLIKKVKETLDIAFS